MTSLLKLTLLLISVFQILFGLAKANCRAIPEDDNDFGNFFPPNPLKLTASMGVITSTNFPMNYNPREQCAFFIEGPPNSRIRLEFSDYNIGEEAILAIFDGNLTPFGGIVTSLPVNTMDIPAPFESNTNFIGINFSAGSDVMRGWRLTYSFIEDSRSENEERPLLFVDSATTTFFLALSAVITIFISGFIP